MRIGLLLLVPSLLAACSPGTDSATDSPLADTRLAEERLPNAERELVLGGATQGELSPQAPTVSWVFQLTDRATVDVRTEAVAGGPELDTLLALQREDQHGFGHVLARDDDRADSHFSELSRSLPAGSYRVLVKGFHRRTQGPFVLRSSCSGPGCPVVPQRCLFGTTYLALRESAGFELRRQSRITAASSARLSRPDAAQLLSAVQVAYTQAHDVGSALSAVDQGQVNRTVLKELASGRLFVAYEYGAGDNSYGAVFEGTSTERAVEIHDGDLYACKVFGTPRGAREGAECSADWGVLCDEGLLCADTGDAFGAGTCSAPGASPGIGAH
jgi:hypothetical protein